MSSFFQRLETAGNELKRSINICHPKETELNRIKRNREGLRVGECGFAGYWNIKGCAHMVGDFNDNFRGLSAICEGGFSALAPQMRHTQKREDQS